MAVLSDCLHYVESLGRTREVQLVSHRDEVLELTNLRTHRGRR
jgi:hypothetical protein